MTQQEKEKLLCELSERAKLTQLEYAKRIQELAAQKRELYRQIDEIKVKITEIMQEQQRSAAELSRCKAEIISKVPETPKDTEACLQVRELVKKIAEYFIKKIDEL